MQGTFLLTLVVNKPTNLNEVYLYWMHCQHWLMTGDEPLFPEYKKAC